MHIDHQVVVFDAADLEAESSFWAGDPSRSDHRRRRHQGYRWNSR